MTIRLCWIITDRKVTNHPSSMLEWTETDVVWNWAFIKLHNKSYLVRGYRNSRCFYLTQFKIFSLSAHTHTPPLSVSIHKRRTDSWWCWPPPHTNTHRNTHTWYWDHLFLKGDDDDGERRNSAGCDVDTLYFYTQNIVWKEEAGMLSSHFVVSAASPLFVSICF